jgi:hypothetical protein
MVGKTSQCRNADARVVTRAWRASSDDRAVMVQTVARYVFGARSNVNGGRSRSARPGGRVRRRLAPGDVSALAVLWGQTFDLMAGIVQNVPWSIEWEIDLSGLNGGDEWVRGAVEALVYTVAHELDVDVTSREA